ncbi:MAG: class I SAM-dependent methyltransferase [Oscillatoriaceae cyanobacterium]
MNNPESDLLAQIRQQFDTAPYPRNPLEESPKDDANLLFIHNLITPYYLRNQKIPTTEGKIILDAGCGTGYASLVLALANPGAKIVGIDLSETSVNLARERLKYHNIHNAEFHAISIEELPQLPWEFDYINADEVLYLLPDPAAALQGLTTVLKPEGIIRTNLHHHWQRFPVFQAQKVFQEMGLGRAADNLAQEAQIESVQQTMKSLKNQVWLKRTTWDAQWETDAEAILLNYLLAGDKGYTVPEMFGLLRQAQLEFISMVNWREWELLDLFKNPDNLPAFLAISLPELSVEERLHIFELLNPVHRLMDFWCGHANQSQPFMSLSDWSEIDWQNAVVELHPQLKTHQFKEYLIDCINHHHPCEISRYLQVPTITPIFIDSSIAPCLLPLWDAPQSVTFLVERWLQVSPVNPATLEPVPAEKASSEVIELLQKLETFLYVLLVRYEN